MLTLNISSVTTMCDIAKNILCQSLCNVLVVVLNDKHVFSAILIMLNLKLYGNNKYDFFLFNYIFL